MPTGICCNVPPRWRRLPEKRINRSSSLTKKFTYPPLPPIRLKNGFPCMVTNKFAYLPMVAIFVFQILERVGESDWQWKKKRLMFPMRRIKYKCLKGLKRYENV